MSAKRKAVAPTVPPNPPIEIRVPHDSRIKAIETLSMAILKVAEALSTGAFVTIRDSQIYNAQTGISVTSEQRDYERTKA